MDDQHFWLHHKILKKNPPWSGLRGQKGSIDGARNLRQNPNSQNRGILAPDAPSRVGRLTLGTQEEP